MKLSVVIMSFALPAVAQAEVSFREIAIADAPLARLPYFERVK